LNFYRYFLVYYKTIIILPLSFNLEL